MFDFDYFSLIVTLISIFLAGVIRGYSGFGFAMVSVTSISLVLPPIQVVPLVLILDVLASIRLIPQVWRDIDWHSLRWLFIGSLFASPIGIYLLSNVGAEPMRISISLSVLVAAIMILYGRAKTFLPGRFLTLTTGMACGILNGAAIGGPPVILFYLSSPVPITVSRASIITYILGIDVMSMIIASIQGLMTVKILLLTAICLTPLYFGIAIGSRLFIKAEKKIFRQNVCILLIFLSVVGLIRGIFG